ncbi:MAG TPA: M56 family metallopeptidase [Candidatus Acidoferrales bacterium]|jgi:beta-lactamase regulating signal transducer with metallopeptidase domain|nr:M56 family metallopeptidase [Candidatus Acidoferrales bacterium]
MNIETLNRWGENFLSFAWPMLWQSSLLIVIIFALDVVSARKIRPAIRHAFWMIVFVKLLLPPTLALPTGVAWWLWPSKPALTPVIRSEAVTYDTTMLSENLPVQPIPKGPPPKLDAGGWSILASGAISAGLLCWLAFKWLSVGRNARKAKAVHEFESPLGEAQQLANLRGPIRLKLIDDKQSPAVYGFFRPVILLPVALADKLSATQLRAVLLHEAIHVRRGDVWVNCAQTLLQIFYWWHPLLWFANARIRRLREEAVDDAVMLALRDEADAYAPTLLEVAKFAFRRPLASLGLVGILESRSALRQRIERLVDFRPPRQAGITLLSLCGIFVFSAVALPMGQAPVSTTDSLSANPQLSSADTSPHRTAVLIEGRFFWMRPGDVETLITGLSSRLGQTGQTGKWTVDAGKWDEINQRIHSLNVKWFAKPRIQTGSGIEADLTMGNATNGYEFDCTPFVTANHLELKYKVHLAQHSWISLPDMPVGMTFFGQAILEDGGGLILCPLAVNNALSNLVLVIGVKTVEPTTASEKNSATAGNVIPNHNTDTLVRDGQMLYEAGKLDEAQSKLKSALALDPDNKGAQYYLNLIAQAKTARPSGRTSVHDGRKSVWDESLNIHLDEFGPYKNAPLLDVINELNRRALNAGADFKIVMSPMTPSPNKILVDLPPMKDVAFTTVFDMITQGANQPVNFSTMDDAIVFKGAEDDLEMRTFKLDTNAFLMNLGKLYKSKGNVSETLEEAFSAAGVDLSPPKTLFYNDGMGILFVHATSNDLDVIERLLQVLNNPPSQIHIKARFFEMPSAADVVANMSPVGPNNDSRYGILTAHQMKVFLQLLQSQNGVEELGEPEATTISGRQMQMRTTETQQVLTNYLFQVPPRPQHPTVVPQLCNVEFGPMFDVVPIALADGYTISLKAIGSRTQFFGYADPKGFTGFTTNYNGSKIQLPVTLPAIQVSSASVQDALLYDDETLVLFPKTEHLLYCPPDEKSRERVAEHIRQAEKKEGNKTLVVFVTVTLIDPSGNRVHSEDGMPFAQNAIPPQPLISETVLP